MSEWPMAHAGSFRKMECPPWDGVEKTRETDRVETTEQRARRRSRKPVPGLRGMSHRPRTNKSLMFND